MGSYELAGLRALSFERGIGFVAVPVRDDTVAASLMKGPLKTPVQKKWPFSISTRVPSATKAWMPVYFPCFANWASAVAASNRTPTTEFSQ